MPLPELPELPAGDLLVTGATGFVGGCLVRALLQRGLPPQRLRCLVRDRARATAAGVPPASVRLCDLDDPSGGELGNAVGGVGLVVHLAGTLKSWNRSGFDQVNVGGTERLARAVRERSPAAHVLLVSSLAAAGPSADGRDTDALPDRCRPVSAYGDSKRRGELVVVHSGLPWTIVRPPVVYGTGDAATRLLFRQACAPLVVVPWLPRPLSLIHADDVVAALWRAMDRRPPGAVLPLDGPARTDTHRLVRAIAEACGRRARLVRVPMPIASLAAAASDAVAALRRKACFFSRDKVRELAAEGWVADGGPARAMLGFVPKIDLATGLAAVAQELTV